jgi:hypothetical protein
MKKHERKAMGKVIYGSRKTAFFEEKKTKFCGTIELYDASLRCCRKLD